MTWGVTSMYTALCDHITCYYTHYEDVKLMLYFLQAKVSDNFKGLAAFTEDTAFLLKCEHKWVILHISEISILNQVKNVLNKHLAVVSIVQ